MKKRKLDLRSLELDDSLEILDLTELQVSIMGALSVTIVFLMFMTI